MIRIELLGSWSARCGALIIDHESACRGSPMCEMARLLIAKGRRPDEMCEAWRGSTLCFAARPLGVWAQLYVAEPDGGNKSARFRRWKPAPTRETTGQHDPAPARPVGA